MVELVFLWRISELRGVEDNRQTSQMIYKKFLHRAHRIYPKDAGLVQNLKINECYMLKHR